MVKISHKLSFCCSLATLALLTCYRLLQALRSSSAVTNPSPPPLDIGRLPLPTQVLHAETAVLRSGSTETSVDQSQSEGDESLYVYTMPRVRVFTAEARWDPYGSKRCLDRHSHEIAVRRSTSFGREWSDTIAVVGSNETRTGNPQPVALRSGRVVLLFKYLPAQCHRKDCGAPEDMYLGNGIVVSDDDGLTWSSPWNISAGIMSARGGQPGPGAGIQLKSGRILSMFHMGPNVRVEVVYSDDEGMSWSNSKQSLPLMDEAAFAETSNNEVLAIMRHQKESKRGKAFARSYDGGITWTQVTYHSNLVGPNCQASLVSLGNGVMLFANPHSQSQKRQQISVQASLDNGNTWHLHMVVECDRTRGYTSLVQGYIMQDKMLTGILFETTPYNAGAIDFQLFRYNSARALAHNGSLDGASSLQQHPQQEGEQSCSDLQKLGALPEVYR